MVSLIDDDVEIVRARKKHFWPNSGTKKLSKIVLPNDTVGGYRKLVISNGSCLGLVQNCDNVVIKGVSKVIDVKNCENVYIGYASSVHNISNCKTVIRQTRDQAKLSVLRKAQFSSLLLALLILVLAVNFKSEQTSFVAVTLLFASVIIGAFSMSLEQKIAKSGKNPVLKKNSPKKIRPKLMISIKAAYLDINLPLSTGSVKVKETSNDQVNQKWVNSGTKKVSNCRKPNEDIVTYKKVIIQNNSSMGSIQNSDLLIVKSRSNIQEAKNCKKVYISYDSSIHKITDCGEIIKETPNENVRDFYKRTTQILTALVAILFSISLFGNGRDDSTPFFFVLGVISLITLIFSLRSFLSFRKKVYSENNNLNRADKMYFYKPSRNIILWDTHQRGILEKLRKVTINGDKGVVYKIRNCNNVTIKNKAKIEIVKNCDKVSVKSGSIVKTVKNCGVLYISAKAKVESVENCGRVVRDTTLNEEHNDTLKYTFFAFVFSISSFGLSVIGYAGVLSALAYIVGVVSLMVTVFFLITFLNSGKQLKKSSKESSPKIENKARTITLDNYLAATKEAKVTNETTSHIEEIRKEVNNSFKYWDFGVLNAGKELSNKAQKFQTLSTNSWRSMSETERYNIGEIARTLKESSHVLREIRRLGLPARVIEGQEKIDKQLDTALEVVSSINDRASLRLLDKIEEERIFLADKHGTTDNSLKI